MIPEPVFLAHTRPGFAGGRQPLSHKSEHVVPYRPLAGIVDIDPDAILEIAGYAFKIWLVLIVLGLPAQLLLGVAARTGQKRLRLVAIIGAAVVMAIAALVTDIAFSSYDGSFSHTFVLWATLMVFSIPAHVLFFFALFRLKRMLPRVAALSGGVALTMLGVVAFGLRSMAYGFQHSLGGWP